MARQQNSTNGIGWQVDSGQPVCAGLVLVALNGIFKCT